MLSPRRVVRGPRFRLGVVGALVAAAALTGCSAPSGRVPEPNAPSSQAPRPAPGGVTLVSLGLTNAPDTVTLPPGVTITRQINQANVVTVLIRPSDGEAVLKHLAANLVGEGFTVTGKSQDSLIFTAPGWEGAFTMNDEVAALTLRRLG